MANRYFLNIGANWGDTANWSDTSGGTGGFSVPTNADDVFFDANSGNCTVNASNRVAKSLDFTGYTNTITMTFAITVSGNVTLSNTMTVAGTGRLQFDANSTITSNGKEWGNIRIYLNGIVLTLADDFTVNNVLFDIANSATATINSNKFKIKGNLDYGGRTGCEINGTTTLMMVGTGSLLALSSRVATSTFEVDTTGTFTINGGFINSANVKYTAGNVTYTTTLLLAATQSVNWTHTITGAGIQFAGVGNTITLLNNINTNTISYGNADGVTVTVNGFQINCTGNLTIGRTSGTLTGSTIINLTGGIWSHTGATVLRMPLVLNGNITISGNVYYNTGTLTYTSGTVTTTGSTLNIAASTTLNTSGVTWNNVTFSATNTTTLTSNLNINGLLTTSGGITTVNGTFNINANNGLTVNAGFFTGTGTPTLNLLAGIWSGSSQVRINININGNVTISGIVGFNSATLTRLSGTVTTTGSQLTLGVASSTLSVTLNTSGISWNNIVFNGTTTATLLSDLDINGLLTINGVTTINGSFNINCSGGISLVGVALNKGTGTPLLYLLGGTCTSSNNSGIIGIDTYINGNITIASLLCINNISFIHLGGDVTNTPKNTLRIGGTNTLDISKININNFISGTNTTLLSDLNIYGLATMGGTWNGDFNINIYGGFSGGALQGTGTTILNLYNGDVTTGASLSIWIELNTFIRGNIKFTGLNFYYLTGTLTYISGKIEQEKGNRAIFGTCTLINIDKVNFRNITIVNAKTVTMNRFFSGSALIPTRIQSLTTVNYNITFQDGFEKITKFTKISNCTVTKRGQLLCITDKSNKGGNVGIRYINQSPNGIAKNAPTSPNPMAYGLPSFLDSDPNFITG